MGRKRQDPVCLRGGGREGGRTAEVLSLREAIKLKLVALMKWEDSPVCLSSLLGRPAGAALGPLPGASPGGGRGAPASPPHPALPAPPGLASPPHPGRWVREIQVA